MEVIWRYRPAFDYRIAGKWAFDLAFTLYFMLI